MFRGMKLSFVVKDRG